MTLPLPGFNVSGYLGEPKERIEVRARLIGISRFNTAFGVTTVLRFKDELTGNLLIWRASKTALGSSDRGKMFDVTGTVKEHGVYKGQKQTVCTRCTTREVVS